MAQTALQRHLVNIDQYVYYTKLRNLENSKGTDGGGGGVKINMPQQQVTVGKKEGERERAGEWGVWG